MIRATPMMRKAGGAGMIFLTKYTQCKRIGKRSKKDTPCLLHQFNLQLYGVGTRSLGILDTYHSQEVREGYTTPIVCERSGKDSHANDACHANGAQS